LPQTARYRQVSHRSISQFPPFPSTSLLTVSFTFVSPPEDSAIPPNRSASDFMSFCVYHFFPPSPAFPTFPPNLVYQMPLPSHLPPAIPSNSNSLFASRRNSIVVGYLRYLCKESECYPPQIVLVFFITSSPPPPSQIFTLPSSSSSHTPLCLRIVFLSSPPPLSLLRPISSPDVTVAGLVQVSISFVFPSRSATGLYPSDPFACLL